MDGAVVHHKQLAESSRWAEMTFAEQMANVGSEVFRAVKWKEKRKPERTLLAADRALELLDFTIQCAQESKRNLKELMRLREVLCDFFYGNNEYGSTQENLNKYFHEFEMKAAYQRYSQEE